MNASTIPTIEIVLNGPDSTKICAKSLILSLYTFPTTILLSGELGAGKTTFVQGLAEGLGITDTVTSPTFALEQRYNGRKHNLLHIDLYRLEKGQADALVAGSDDWDGIRCIEWPQRLQTQPANSISLYLEEIPNGRKATLSFEDMALPTESEIEQWRKDVMLPEHIVGHCQAVADTCAKVANALLSKGIIVRKNAVIQAGKLHDLFRFVDFKGEGGMEAQAETEEQKTIWRTWKTRHPNLGHEELCSIFLENNGFIHLADIIKTHGLMTSLPHLRTIEQKVLYYADKRVKMDEVVTIQQRFDDFRERYQNGKHTEQAAAWQQQCDVLEKELFPDGPPF